MVRYGRFPYQSLFARWTKDDEYHVQQALELTQLQRLAELPLNQLSGGQRQRAWVAMVLAQNTSYILLDEPTTYLDINYQIEILDLLHVLNKKHQKTIVMVLHDLNLAARYADELIVIDEQQAAMQGNAQQVLQEVNIKRFFDLDNKVIVDPFHDTPICIPLTKQKISH
ncbi:Petrobactin import ATP-binding protein FpuD [Oligella sp. MSHR50489EDL]